LRFRIILITVLIISGGCVQFTPSYMTASSYEKALLLYNEGRVVDAREKAMELKKGEPQYKAAQELLSRIDRLASRLAEKHAGVAEEYEKAGLYSTAAREYRTALKFTPANQSIRKRLEAAEEGRPYPQKEEEPVKSKVVISPEALALEHYQKGVVFFEAKQYGNAIDEFNMVQKLVPSYKDTDRFLSISMQERDEIVSIRLKKGIEYFQKEDLELAVKEWDIVLELDPTNKIAIDYKARAEAIMEKMKEIKEKGR